MNQVKTNSGSGTAELMADEAKLSTYAACGWKPQKLPAHSPNLNAFAERWVRSVKEECLSRLIFFGEHSLRRALTEYIDHAVISE